MTEFELDEIANFLDQVAIKARRRRRIPYALTAEQHATNARRVAAELRAATPHVAPCYRCADVPVEAVA